MSISEKNKLSDESLEFVSGGTNAEMHELQTKMGVKNLSEVSTGLKQMGISSKLSTREKDKYIDEKTGKTLTHSQVVSKL